MSSNINNFNNIKVLYDKSGKEIRTCIDKIESRLSTDMSLDYSKDHISRQMNTENNYNSIYDSKSEKREINKYYSLPKFNKYLEESKKQQVDIVFNLENKVNILLSEFAKLKMTESNYNILKEKQDESRKMMYIIKNELEKELKKFELLITSNLEVEIVGNKSNINELNTNKSFFNMTSNIDYKKTSNDRNKVLNELAKNIKSNSSSIFNLEADLKKNSLRSEENNKNLLLKYEELSNKIISLEKSAKHKELLMNESDNRYSNLETRINKYFADKEKVFSRLQTELSNLEFKILNKLNKIEENNTNNTHNISEFKAQINDNIYVSKNEFEMVRSQNLSELENLKSEIKNEIDSVKAAKDNDNSIAMSNITKEKEKVDKLEEKIQIMEKEINSINNALNSTSSNQFYNPINPKSYNMNRMNSINTIPNMNNISNFSNNINSNNLRGSNFLSKKDNFFNNSQINPDNNKFNSTINNANISRKFNKTFYHNNNRSKLNEFINNDSDEEEFSHKQSKLINESIRSKKIFNRFSTPNYIA